MPAEAKRKRRRVYAAEGLQAYQARIIRLRARALQRKMPIEKLKQHVAEARESLKSEHDGKQ